MNYFVGSAGLTESASDNQHIPRPYVHIEGTETSECRVEIGSSAADRGVSLRLCHGHTHVSRAAVRTLAVNIFVNLLTVRIGADQLAPPIGQF
jgi:hypothetical protein